MSFFSFLLLKICWFSQWEEQQVAIFQHLIEEKVLQLCSRIGLLKTDVIAPASL